MLCISQWYILFFDLQCNFLKAPLSEELYPVFLKILTLLTTTYNLIYLKSCTAFFRLVNENDRVLFGWLAPCNHAHNSLVDGRLSINLLLINPLPRFLLHIYIFKTFRLTHNIDTKKKKEKLLVGMSKKISCFHIRTRWCISR